MFVAARLGLESAELMKLALITAACLSLAARAEEKEPPSWQFGLAAGLAHQSAFGNPASGPAVPLGVFVTDDNSLSFLRAEALRIVAPVVAVGGFIEYSRFGGQQGSCSDHRFNCTGNYLRIGLQLRFESYRPPKTRWLNPWFAIGGGYELLYVGSVDERNNSLTVSFGGIEVHAQAGLDFITPVGLRFGPFVQGSVGTSLDTQSFEVTLSQTGHSSIGGGLSVSFLL
jgi:hypothetical protein